MSSAESWKTETFQNQSILSKMRIFGPNLWTKSQKQGFNPVFMGILTTFKRSLFCERAGWGPLQNLGNLKHSRISQYWVKCKFLDLIYELKVKSKVEILFSWLIWRYLHVHYSAKELAEVLCRILENWNISESFNIE